MKLAVSEAFYSMQGEGATMGVPSVFLRLSGCNLMCGGQGTQFDKELHNGATWRCDTIEVWMKGIAKEFRHVLNEDLQANLRQGAHLVITGGEPLMQQESLISYLEWLDCEKGITPYIEVETNGTIFPSKELLKRIDQFNISPKLSNSGNLKEQRYNIEAIKKFFSLQYRSDVQCRAWFKFVVSGEDDWKEIEADFLPHIAKKDIILMPAGESQAQLFLSRDMAVWLALRNGVRYCTRLHIDIWNKKTGV